MLRFLLHGRHSVFLLHHRVGWGNSMYVALRRERGLCVVVGTRCLHTGVDGDAGPVVVVMMVAVVAAAVAVTTARVGLTSLLWW